MARGLAETEASGAAGESTLARGVDIGLLLRNYGAIAVQALPSDSRFARQ